jgi:hypothetical protein
MRKTTEQLAKEKSGCITQESVDVLFARRKPRRDANKYTWDSWRGMSRLIVASTGRIVCVCEDFRDTKLIMDALNHKTPNARLSGAGTASA